MSIIRFLLILGSSWISYTSFGQPQRLHFNHLTVNDGLSQANNYHIYKDSRGLVWLSSLNGLNRFDGHSVQVYKHDPTDPNSLPDNYLQSGFFETPTGDLWFSTYRAVVQYRRATDDFKSYQLTLNGKSVEGYVVSHLAMDGSVFVCVNETALYQMTPANKWKKWHDLNTTRVWHPLSTTDNQINAAIAFQPNTAGLYLFDYQQDTIVNSTSLFQQESSNPIYPLSILADGEELIWLGLQDGLATLNIENRSWQFYPFNQTPINKIQHFDDQFLLLSCGGKTLHFFDKHTRTFVKTPSFYHQPNQPNSLSANMTMTVYVDDQQTIWTNTATKGVDYAHPAKIKFPLYTVENLFPTAQLANGVFSITEDVNQQIYVSSRRDGIMVLDDKKRLVKHYSNRLTPAVLPSNDVFFILTDSAERVWAFTWGGFARKRKNETHFTTLQAGNIFLHGLELRNQQLLFAHYGGGMYHMNTAKEVERLPDIDSNLVFTFLFENQSHQLYAAHDFRAIDIYDTQDNFKKIHTIPLKSHVLDMCESQDEKYLYLATNDGLIQFDQTTYELKFITEKDGLADQMIYSVTEDAKGYLWLTSNRGIIRYQPQTNQVTNFGIADGVQGLEFNTFSHHQRADGELWLGGAYGLNIFHPDKIELLTDTTKVQITNLLINDQLADLSQQTHQNVTELKALNLPYFDNTISIQFAAMEYSAPQQNQFRYRIHHYDQDWIKNKSGFARYANLPAGEYTFTAQATNSDGVWGTPKDLQIIIQSPFWETWWFRILVVSAIAAVFYGIYRYRLAQIQRIQRLRNRIADDLHDDIGGNLSHVNILTALIRQRTQTTEQIVPLLGRIEDEVQRSAQSLDDIIFSINPKNDSLERVFARMRWFANDVFEAQQIGGIIQLPPTTDRWQLGMEKRQHFYFFFKEAVNNLAKYAECKRAHIQVKQRGQQLHLRIEDDGKGFAINEPSQWGNGLRTMQQRAEQLGGTMNIVSKIDEGTRIELTFPF